MTSNARRTSSRDDSNPFWIAVQSCFSLARSPSGMEDAELGELEGVDAASSVDVTATVGDGGADAD